MSLSPAAGFTSQIWCAPPQLRTRRVGASSSEGSRANCVARILALECLLQLLEEAGFTDAEMVETTGYCTSPETIGALFRARKPIPLMQLSRRRATPH
jgi:hypothetical protein